LNSKVLSMLYPQHPHNPSRGGGYVGGIWKTRAKEVMRGKASLPTIRWGRIPFKAKAMLDKDGKLRLIDRDDDLWWAFPLGGAINRRTGEGWHELRVATRKLDDSRLSILKKLRDGTYRCGDFQLAWNAKKKFLEVVVFYSAPQVEPEEEFIPGRYLGVDLGIKQSAAALSDAPYKQGWQALHEATSQLIHTKQGIEGHRRETLRRLNRPDVRRSHGRQAKYHAMRSLDEKWNNFRHTWNHNLSRRIVDLAVNNRCEGIRLEDLHGKFTDTETFLGRNWPLYELWQMITYKAEERGIKVEFIDPAYTSRRCHKCGHVEEGFSFDYRKKHGFPQFKCSVCGWEGDADLNAAKNIANPEVEEEIKKARLAQVLEEAAVFV